ncbi:MAG: uncharacterized membrane protein YhaH (DUF805 family) [Candidatus Paceibacteria bacterium]|jgi:uncharacterized membrane protein YhaH (DUF805 family)
MTFADAIKTCFSKYADFNGRASREEFWYFALFTLLGSLVLNMIDNTASVVFSLVTVIPLTAAASRRLHDTNRSGWLQLLWLVPMIGWIIVVIFMAQEAKEPNQFGPSPDTSLSP